MLSKTVNPIDQDVAARNRLAPAVIVAMMLAAVMTLGAAFLSAAPGSAAPGSATVAAAPAEAGASANAAMAALRLTVTPPPAPTPTPTPGGFVRPDCTPTLTADPEVPRVGDEVRFTLAVDCTCPSWHTGSCYWSNYAFDSVSSENFDFSGVSTGSSGVYSFTGIATEAGWATVNAQWYGELQNGTSFQWAYMRPELQMQVRPAIDTTTLQAEYDAALALWQASNIESYSVDLRPICFCISNPTIRSWVYRFGFIHQVSDDGQPIWQGLEDEPPIQLMFDVVGDALASGDFDAMTVVYDETYGFPTTVSIDRSFLIADEEITYLLSNFVPNDGLAKALYEVSVADLDGPGSAFSMTTRYDCAATDLCLPGSFNAEVDIRDRQVVASIPEVSIYPFWSVETMTGQWERALLEAARMQASGEYTVDVQATFDGELFFLRSFALELTPVDSRRPNQTFSGSIDSFGPFGCCQPSTGEPTIVYEESFEGSTDWTFGPDTATTGSFGVMTPQATEFRGVALQPNAASDGLTAMVTDGRAGYSVGSYDIDKGAVTTTSPIIGLPSGPVSVSLDWYFGHGSWQDAGDYLEILVEPVGDPSQARTLVSIDGSQDQPASWASATADISEFAGQNIRLVVTAADEGTGGLVEAGVDNIVIVSGPTGPPSGGAVLWSENFENGGDDWKFGRQGATSGFWSAGDPQGTSYRGQLLQQENASVGSHALVTDPHRGYRTGMFDIDNGSVVATSPAISIPVNILPTETRLNFDWYFTHLERTDSSDYLLVEIEGSQRTVEVLAVLGTPAYRSNAWESASVDISQFQGQEIRIVVTAADGGTGSLIEAGVDNFSITMENLAFPQ